MRVLVGCEFSAIVRDAFRARGHDAWSCDVLCCERGPKHHIRDDVRNHLGDGWDLGIFHPPCTFLSYAGNAHWNNPGRATKRAAAMKFFLDLYHCEIPSVCVENPLGHPVTEFRRPDQAIQPYEYGDNKRKRTCLWLRNLPLLIPENSVSPPPPQYIQGRNGGRIKNRYSMDALRPSPTRGQKRSRFFPGVAAAMARQWGVVTINTGATHALEHIDRPSSGVCEDQNRIGSTHAAMAGAVIVADGEHGDAREIQQYTGVPVVASREPQSDSGHGFLALSPSPATPQEAGNV